ncbi:MAG: DUF4404 family protein [Ignavibacteria bacterium]
MKKTIEIIEEKIRANGSITAANKTELLELIAKLKPEIINLSNAQIVKAENVAGLQDASTNEVIRTEKTPVTLHSALDGLTAMVNEFEESHPELVKNVNHVATTLANMGI